MTTDELFRGLDRVESLLERHEPDRQRLDWSSAAADLAVLHQLLDECRAGLDDGLVGLEASDERELVIARLTEYHAGAAALLAASGESMSARQLIRRAVEMAPLASDLAREARAAETDLDRFADLTCARRLWRLGHLVRAQAILKRLAAGRTDALADAARALLDGPRPVSRVPALFTWNGIGLTLVGERDGSGDGRYVTTHCFSILGIPIIPLAAYRVSDAGGGYYFHAREKLSPLARRARLLVPLAVALVIAGISIGAYFGSTERQIRLALEAAGEMEEAGRLDDALAAYDRMLGEFVDPDSRGELRPAAAGIMRITAGRLPEPVGPGSVEAIRRVVLRFEQIDGALRTQAIEAALREKLLAWADQIGGADLAARLASLRVLELAEGAVGSADVTWRIDRLRIHLAAELAAERPIEALRQYAAVSDRASVIEPMAVILTSFEPGSSLWGEADDAVESWLSTAPGHPRALEVKTRRDQVREREREPARVALLEGADVAALTAAAAAGPHDHGVAVALARAHRDAGKTDQAIAVMTALGPPGRTTAEAQAALGSLYADAGKLDEAERVLVGLMTSELAVYQDAASAFQRVAEAAEAALIEKAQRGEIPVDVQAQASGATQEKQQEILSTWMRTELEGDRRLVRLAEETRRRSHVVPAVLALGMVRLRQANAASGDARTRLLAGAEEAFLSVRSQAEGQPEFHLGLGQVYYRLGKTEEGERELASVLAAKEGRLRLLVADVYRELGMRKRAAEVAEAVWNGFSDAESRNGAATLRSLVADDREEEETWLGRADQSIPFVRRSLMSLRGDRKLREGDVAAADELFAAVAAEYGSEAALNGASANNAALAETRRFRCTGNLAHLEKAASYLVQSYRMQPESAIVASNLANEWWELATNRVLATWIDLAALRPSQSETMTLLTTLADGPERAKLAARITSDPAYRRSIDVLRQWQILAPQDEAPYFFEQGVLELLDDGRGMAALHDRVGHVSDASTKYEEWATGRMDESSRKELDESRARYKGLLDKSGADKKVRAAVLVLYADALRVETMIGDADAATAERERLLTEAASLWPIHGIERELAGVRVEAAILGAAAESAEARAVWNAKRRSHHRSLITNAIAEASPAARDALLHQPKLAEARPFFERLADDDSLQRWLFAHALGDAEMERRAAESLRGSNALIKARLDARLRPTIPWAKENLALLEKIAGP